MLCTVEKIPPAPEPPPLPLQPGGPTTRSPAGMEDEGIADDDGFGDRWSCAAAADSARTRSCRMASASSSSLPMASRKEEQSWTEAELCERREGECLPLSASIGPPRGTKL